MEIIQDLHGNEAHQKIKEILKHNKMAMMTSAIGQIPPSTSPMSTQRIDENGHLWFLALKSSDHYKNIKKNSNVHLTYANNDQQEYLSILGEARIVVNAKDLIAEVWTKDDEEWFYSYKDHNLSLIQIEIRDAYYWDVEKDAAVDIIKAVTSAFTNTTEDHVKGHVDLDE